MVPLTRAAALIRWISVSEKTLAVDVTRQVGISGSFLDAEHTLMHFRSEFFEPLLLFRKKREDWNAMGRPSLSDAAEDCADALISREQAPYLTEEQDAALAEIEAQFLSRLG